MRSSRIGLLAIVPLLGVVLGSAWWASFRSLSWVGAAINIDPGWVFPLSVDGGIALGLASAVIHADGPRRLKVVTWSIVGLGSVTSVASNIAHSGMGNGWHLAAGAVPAVMLGLSIELTIMAVRPVRQDGRVPDVSAAPVQPMAVTAPATNGHGKRPAFRSNPARPDVAAKVAELRADGQDVTGELLAAEFGVSARTGRRWLGRLEAPLA